MDPDQFVRLASSIAVNSQIDEAARCRTAVGRAYYGAFNRTKIVLKSLGTPVLNNARGHTDAYEFLQKSNDQYLVKIGGLLRSLQTARHWADYDLRPRPVVEETNNVKKLVQDADAIIKELKVFLGDTSRMSTAKTKIIEHLKQAGRWP